MSLAQLLIRFLPSTHIFYPTPSLPFFLCFYFLKFLLLVYQYLQIILILSSFLYHFSFLFFFPWKFSHFLFCLQISSTLFSKLFIASFHCQFCLLNNGVPVNNNELSKEGCGEPSLLVLAHFLRANISPMPDFKPPTLHPWKQSWGRSIVVYHYASISTIYIHYTNNLKSIGNSKMSIIIK